MSSLVLATFMTILLVLAHASMLLNSVSKSVSESSGTKRVAIPDVEILADCLFAI